ncbi:hypothetical protein BYZ73_20640 [Rhodovulum viride]|uniref:Uncharacterized protein n=1 Tax=Rhodovulum viride TaxID=1231134 RepID=A0ABX9DCJ9_9RHOB|nr:hypothetical protein [Rhodovulum viride]RAP39424.1 hypothetical protein BYZ73_20640 [Rhodovulum viride]
MALSQFPTVMPQAVSAILGAATALRYLRETSGDLTWYSVEAVQTALRSAKASTLAAIAEAQKAPAAAEAFMAGIGGPTALPDLIALADEIEAAASAWNDALTAWVSGLPASDLIRVVTIATDGILTRHIERPAFVPAARAAALRARPELAALIGAFDAVGA